MKYTTLIYEPRAYDTFETGVLEALSDGRAVVVNLDYVPALETEDMRRLIWLLRQSREIGSDLALRVTRPDLRKTLAFTGLDRVFIVFNDAA